MNNKHTGYQTYIRLATRHVYKVTRQIEIFNWELIEAFDNADLIVMTAEMFQTLAAVQSSYFTDLII